MNASQNLIRQIERAQAAFTEFLARRAEMETFEKVVDLIAGAIKKGGRLYIAGNGGSAADSQHIAGELVCKLGRARKALPAESLAADVATLTAIGNDFGYEFLFSRQLEAKATERDVFLALTTSGKSPNILRALLTCKSLGVKSVALTGYQGGAVREVADYCIVATGEDASAIQQLHLVIYHTLCHELEERLAF